MLQAGIQKEREATQALVAAKEKEMEERTARLLEEERARSDPGHLRALHGKILLHIFQILHLMFVSLIMNIIDL